MKGAMKARGHQGAVGTFHKGSKALPEHRRVQRLQASANAHGSFT